MTDNNKDKELSYYAQGNELGASVEDAKGNKFTETRNEADGLTINHKDKYNQQLQSIKDNYKVFTTRRCSSTTILTTWVAVVTSPTTTEAKDGKMPKNPFIMDEIVISAPKSKM